MFCRSELARLAKLRTQIEANGAHILVMTLGKPHETEAFCADRAPGIQCQADPEASAYKQFGLGRGSMHQLFGPQVWLQGALASTDGKFEGLPVGKPVGDPWQMPGVFVIGRDGKIKMAYYSQHAGDYPSDDSLIAAGKL